MSLYCPGIVQRPMPSRSRVMTKEKQSNKKESKKQPLLNPKEKKAAKQAKKHASDTVPIVHR